MTNSTVLHPLLRPPPPSLRIVLCIVASAVTAVSATSALRLMTRHSHFLNNTRGCCYGDSRRSLRIYRDVGIAERGSLLPHLVVHFSYNIYIYIYIYICSINGADGGMYQKPL